MSKKINGEDIRRFSKGILKVMIDRRISSLEDFKENVGRYPIGESGEEVVIEPRPSSQGTLASTISYIVLGLGVLIEVRINQELGYSRITLKKIRKISGRIFFILPRLFWKYNTN